MHSILIAFIPFLVAAASAYASVVVSPEMRALLGSCRQEFQLSKSQLRRCAPGAIADFALKAMGPNAIEGIAEAKVSDLAIYNHLMTSGQTPKGHWRAYAEAACQNQPEYIRKWIKAVNAQDTNEFRRELGKTMARGVGRCGNVQALEWVLRYAEINTDDLFRGASEGGQIEFIQNLRQVHRLSASQQTVNEMAIDAGYFRHRDLLLFLLNNGMDVTPSSGALGDAFIYAAKVGDLEIMDVVYGLFPAHLTDLAGITPDLALHNQYASLGYILKLRATRRLSPKEVERLFLIGFHNGYVGVMDCVASVYPLVVRDLDSAFLVDGAREGLLESIRAVFVHMRPKQIHINMALGEAMVHGHDRLAYYLLNEAPKRAHGPDRHRPVVPFKKYTNGWFTAIIETLKRNNTERAAAILNRYKPTQKEHDEIFAHAFMTDQVDAMIKAGLKPSSKIIDKFLPQMLWAGGEFVPRMFAVIRKGFRPSQDAIDHAFTYFAFDASLIEGLYREGLKPSSKAVRTIVQQYALGSKFDLKPLVEVDVQKLRDAVAAVEKKLHKDPKAQARLQQIQFNN